MKTFRPKRIIEADTKTQKLILSIEIKAGNRGARTEKNEKTIETMENIEIKKAMKIMKSANGFEKACNGNLNFLGLTQNTNSKYDSQGHQRSWLYGLEATSSALNLECHKPYRARPAPSAAV